VIAKAMAPQAADRYRTARDFDRALAEPETAEKLRPRRRRQARMRTLAGAALVAVAVLAAWWLFGRGTPLEAAGPYPLAVLPPENLTGEEDYFVVGQHQALIDQLAAISGFRVISRRTVARYDDGEETIPEIAEALGVQGIVVSSLTREGDTVRVGLQLIQAEPEEDLVWSGSFAGDLSGLYSMYREAALSIASGAGVGLTPAEESRLTGERPIDPATYEAYLRGMHQLQKRTPEGIQQGLAYLHEATDRNPADALAWAGLALGYATVGHGPSAPPGVWQKARAAAERAVRLDSMLAEGWAALADVRTYYEWDWKGAEEAFRRANELNPNLAMNHYHYAWYLLLMNRYEEAKVQHELAYEIEPLIPFQAATLGALYLYDGDTEAAIEQTRRALELNPDGSFGLLVLGWALLLEGRYDEAIATSERLAELHPVWRGELGLTYAYAGRTEDARRIAAELESQEQDPFGAYGLARLYGALGENDDAFRWLAYEPPHAWVPWVAVEPILEIPWDDPRFHDFLRRLNLPNFQD
jgi:tetratricopeptide (TPR) repeat protein